MKINLESILNIFKNSDELKKFLNFLVIYFDTTLKKYDEFDKEVKQLEDETGQDIDKDMFLHDFWSLRFSFPFIWFCDLRITEIKEDFANNAFTFKYALKIALERNDKSAWLPWVTKGTEKYIDFNKERFTNFEGLNEQFTEKVGDNVPQMVFDCTGGRLGGELHDALMELIMATIQQDQKVFNMVDTTELSDQEEASIKKSIEDMKPTQKDFEDFLDKISEK